MKIKTNLGLLSSSLIDSISKDQYQKLQIEGKSENEIALIEEKDEEMVVALTQNTRRVAKLLSPSDVGIENRMYHHMLLAQKLLASTKLDPRESRPSAMLIRSWVSALPTNDLTNMLYWEKQQLIEVDSPSLIAQYKQAGNFN